MDPFHTRGIVQGSSDATGTRRSTLLKPEAKGRKELHVRVPIKEEDSSELLHA